MKIHRNYILIILLLTFFILGGVLAYQWWRASIEEIIVEKIPEKDGLQEESFSKIVTGYAVLEQVELPSKEDFEKYYWDLPPGHLPVEETYVYFKIINSTDEEFVKDLEETIEEGNTINSKSNGHILFNLGCLENDKIVADGRGIDYYMDRETWEAVLKSTEENLIVITLYFDSEAGAGCRCCSFAKKIRLHQDNN